jgi:molybdate/tungstate transport system substrate-binding protein
MMSSRENVMRLTRLLTSLLLILVILLSGCGPQAKTPLVVFAAGSLIQPFNDLAKAFEAKNPDVSVQSEFHGSIQVIRQVTDLHQKIDVVATADESLLPMLMYTGQDSETAQAYASWSIKFATNRLGIAYTAKSKHADEINEQNWYKLLAQPDVKVGIADPRFDASGYRTLMIYQLSQEYYKKPTLFFDTFQGAFKYPIQVEDENGVSVIHVPEILETRDNAHIVLRGASLQLLALLESGDLDYAFEYESVIQQHKFQLVKLPDALNLGAPGMAANYGKVSVRLDFQRFAAVKPEFRGEQIAYGITIPSNAPHPREAARFIQFIFSQEGRQIMNQNYHPVYDPLVIDHPASLPADLAGLKK